MQKYTITISTIVHFFIRGALSSRTTTSDAEIHDHNFDYRSFLHPWCSFWQNDNLGCRNTRSQFRLSFISSSVVLFLAERQPRMQKYTITISIIVHFFIRGALSGKTTTSDAEIHDHNFDYRSFLHPWCSFWQNDNLGCRNTRSQFRLSFISSSVVLFLAKRQPRMQKYTITIS